MTGNALWIPASSVWRKVRLLASKREMKNMLIEIGTSIPSELVMWRDGVSRFSLQPSAPTEVESKFHLIIDKHIGYVIDCFAELNELLSSFYENSATIMSAQEWIEKHPYKESLPDQNEEAWMKA